MLQSSACVLALLFYFRVLQLHWIGFCLKILTEIWFDVLYMGPMRLFVLSCSFSMCLISASWASWTFYIKSLLDYSFICCYQMGVVIVWNWSPTVVLSMLCFFYSCFDRESNNLLQEGLVVILSLLIYLPLVVFTSLYPSSNFGLVIKVPIISIELLRSNCISF